MRTEFLLVGVILASILVMAGIARYAVKERGCRCLECKAEHVVMSNKMYDAVSITIIILVIMAAVILLQVPAPEVTAVKIGAEAKYTPKNFHQFSREEVYSQNCRMHAPTGIVLQLKH